MGSREYWLITYGEHRGENKIIYFTETHEGSLLEWIMTMKKIYDKYDDNYRFCIMNTQQISQQTHKKLDEIGYTKSTNLEEK